MKNTTLLVLQLWLIVACSLPVAEAAQQNPAQPTDSQTSGASAGAKPDQNANKPTRIYQVGGSVKPPKAIPSPQSATGTSAKKAKNKKDSVGTTLLSVVIGEDGSVYNVRVLQSLSKDLDARANESAKKLKFQPATKNGVPVAVEIAIEVEVHLN